MYYLLHFEDLLMELIYKNRKTIGIKNIARWYFIMHENCFKFSTLNIDCVASEKVTDIFIV